MRKAPRRPLALLLALLIAVPQQLLAAAVPPTQVSSPPLRVRTSFELPLSCGGDGTDVINGVQSRSSAGGRLKPQSPGLLISPSYHSSNRALTPWGRGWSSDLDHFLSIGSGGTLTWQDGLGNRLVFYRKTASNTLPIPFSSPIGEFSELKITAMAGTQPTAAELKDLDGTVRRFTLFESTAALRLARLTDRNGNTIDYTRNAQGRLTRAQDVYGRFVTFTYDAAGLVAGVADSGGRTASYTYDAQGRKIAETGPEGTTSYEYDALHRMTKVTYPNGGIKNYAYDAQDRVISEDEGAGQNQFSYAYHASSTVVTDALNRSTVYEFVSRQGLKKVTRIIAPDNGVTSFAYDANFNLVSQTDPLGRITRYTYDSKGNVTQVQDTLGGLTKASYEPAFNQLTRITDPLGRSTDLGYDAKGNLTQLTDALSHSSQMSYDANGHLTAYEDPLNNATQFTYNPTNGSLATITDPLSRQTVLQTDALNRVTRNTDPAGKQTQFEYDPAGNLTKVTDAMGGVTRYTYEPGRDGKLLTVVKDARGNETTFGYDEQGRVTSIINALGQTKSYVYDAKGRLTQMTNARGQVLSYAYDDLDRLITKTLPEGTVSYEYDAAGNLTKATNFNGSIVEVSYDDLNRVTQSKQTLPRGYQASIGYAYDANGNRTLMTTPWGNFSYEYDSLNRLTKITNPQSKQFSFEYDSAGRRSKLIYPNGVETTYNYDDAGQVLGIIHTRVSDGAVVAKSTYSYDSAGNRTSMTDLSGTHSYDYDGLGQISAASHPSASDLQPQNEVFSYDITSNRLSDAQTADYVYDDAGRIISNSSFTYTNDASGNIASRTNLASGQAISFVHDSANRLVEVTGSTNTIAQYKYDARGNRVEKNAGGVVMQYVYDGANVLAILSGAEPPLIVTHASGIDALLTAHSSGQEYFYHTDALDHVSVLTDGTGNVTETVKYLVFGKALISDGQGIRHAQSPAGNLFFYTSRELDSETGMYYFRSRYLDANTGRFIQEDPLLNIHPYTYVYNNPISYTDPLGADLELEPGPNKAATAAARDAYNRLYNTPFGKTMCDSLKNEHGVKYIIRIEPGLNDSYFNFNTRIVHFDPYYHPVLKTTNGPASAAASIVLAHELGHAYTGLADLGPNRMDNVNASENIYRTQAGFPLRTQYALYGESPFWDWIRGIFFPQRVPRKP